VLVEYACRVTAGSSAQDEKVRTNAANVKSVSRSRTQWLDASVDEILTRRHNDQSNGSRSMKVMLGRHST
jgi:hypothetical protein